MPRSKKLIFANSPSTIFNLTTAWGGSLRFALTLGLAALVIYVAAIFSNPPAGGRLVEQTPPPDFNIELRKAKYFREVAPNVYIVVLENQEKNKVEEGNKN